MEQNETNRKPNPKDEANFLSRFLFCWQIPIFAKYRKKDFTENDIPATSEEHEAKKLGDKLETKWHEDNSLKRVLFQIFGLEYIFWGVISLPVDLAFIMLQPLCLQQLLLYFTPQEVASKNKSYVYASVIVVLYFLRVLTTHWFNLKFLSFGMRIRIACCSLIYRKCLKMKKVTVGEAVNLVTNDTSRFEYAFIQLYYGWNGLFKLVVGAIYINSTFGHAATTGLVIFIIGFIIQAYTSKQMATIRMQVASKTDQRIRTMSDIIYGVQVIKTYTWEKPFTELITEARKSEMRQIFKYNLFRLTSYILNVYLAEIAIFICILALVLTDIPVSASYIFALINVYNNLTTSVLMPVPQAAMSYADVKTSIERIQKFLLSEYEPIKAKYIDAKEKIKGVHLNHVGVLLGNFQILDNITFHVNPGELVGVMGHAGSGKSTLLQVILGEIATTTGSMTITGTISYASQEPWIFPASVKQNILFGEDLDEEKYRKVLQVCALEHDLNLLPNGDLSLVGERGLMLSGGQKSRINLARAIYRDADIYLLDDPLSSVDSHVAHHIFLRCILNYLKGKSVILVTHQTRFLMDVPKVYCFNMGKIINTNFRKSSNEELDVDVIPPIRSDPPTKIKEHRSSGLSSGLLLRKYFFSSKQVIQILLNFILTQVVLTSITWYLTTWINNPEILTPRHFLYIYVGIISVLVVLTHTESLIFVKYCTKISGNLHEKLFSSVLKTTTRFFSDHSSGRVLNRFSLDLSIIDERIPLQMEEALSMFLSVLAAVITVSVINYWLVLPTVLLFVLFYIYLLVFERININLRRTEGITQSPILTHLVATIQGLATIRASKRTPILVQQFDGKIDTQSAVCYLHKATFFTFSVWVDLTCALYVAVVTFSFLLLETNVLTGDVGLAITQSSLLVGMVQYGMRMWSKVDAQMTSVERILEYSQLEPEPDCGKVVPKHWPQFGGVKFEKVYLRYSPDKPLVLKNVNLVLKPGEKVGVVGRTGAGKTSLVSTLFRLFVYEGTIYIDEVDTKTVPLKFLRSKISVIPQEPIFFSGSLRKNLDPFGAFSDYEIWAVLDDLQLTKFVQDLPSGLDSTVAERGSGFSVGEKQLLCLVRALLRNCKIVVFDEATASIDMETDGMIQSIIRRKFKECTVLTIAHRLNTVMDSDKIVVMESGEVVEFGEPKKLLENVGGFFYALMKKMEMKSTS